MANIFYYRKAVLDNLEPCWAFKEKKMKDCNCDCCTCENYEEKKKKWIPKKGDFFVDGTGPNIYICTRNTDTNVECVCIQSPGSHLNGYEYIFFNTSTFVRQEVKEI